MNFTFFIDRFFAVKTVIFLDWIGKDQVFLELSQELCQQGVRKVVDVGREGERPAFDFIRKKERFGD